MTRSGLHQASAPRERNHRPAAPRRPEGEVQDLSKARHLQPKPEGRPRNDNRRPDDQKGDRARFERPRDDKPKFQQPREERKEKAFDPDSPFAKLMALKAPKGQ